MSSAWIARTSAPRSPRLWVGYRTVRANAPGAVDREGQAGEQERREESLAEAHRRTGYPPDRERGPVTGRASPASVRVGGSAPGRWQVRLGDLDGAGHGLADGRLSRPGRRDRDPARPTTRGRRHRTHRRCRRCPRRRRTGPAARARTIGAEDPDGTRARRSAGRSRGPSASRSRAASIDGPVRREVRQVVAAHLHDVGPAEDRREASRGRRRDPR